MIVSYYTLTNIHSCMHSLYIIICKYETRRDSRPVSNSKAQPRLGGNYVNCRQSSTKEQDNEGLTRVGLKFLQAPCIIGCLRTNTPSSSRPTPTKLSTRCAMKKRTFSSLSNQPSNKSKTIWYRVQYMHAPYNGLSASKNRHRMLTIVSKTRDGLEKDDRLEPRK